MEPSPWEALDIDDSDLQSLLRPCNRRRRQTDSHSLSSSQPHHPTLPPNPNPNFSHSLQPPQFHPPPPPETQFVIPGPAGAVQAAMHRKARANCGDGPAMPTQEYIRRAVEEGQEDDDFDRHPWLSALQFLGGPQDTVDGGLPSTPLSSIKKCLNIGRLGQVVAVIKSCIPNGLGGLMVTLKDPTGTINASVHHKALVEVEFANKISVGSVLILRKVVVFAPSRSSHYLNITPSNIVKVISVDSSPPIKPNYVVSATEPAALASECRRETDGTEMVSSLEQDRTEAQDDARKLREKRNHLSHGNPCIRTSRREDQCGDAGCLMRQNAAEEIIKRAVRTDGIDSDQRVLDIGKKVQEAVCSSSRLQNVGPVAKLDEKQNHHEICRANGAQSQRQPLMCRATLPEWTDEQLNELFAADAEDDESLF